MPALLTDDLSLRTRACLRVCDRRCLLPCSLKKGGRGKHPLPRLHGPDPAGTKEADKAASQVKHLSTAQAHPPLFRSSHGLPSERWWRWRVDPRAGRALGHDQQERRPGRRHGQGGASRRTARTPQRRAEQRLCACAPALRNALPSRAPAARLSLRCLLLSPHRRAGSRTSPTKTRRPTRRRSARSSRRRVARSQWTRRTSPMLATRRR